MPDPDDGRATFAAITPKGRSELRRTAPRYLAGIDTHFTSLFTAEERKQLTGLLQRVADRHADTRSGTRHA